MEQAQAPPLKLNGENWIIWKFQTSVMLKGRGMYGMVSGGNPKPESGNTEIAKWLKDDAKAQELIVTRMEQGPLTHLLSCETAKDMWVKLKAVYDKESMVSVHLLQQKFFMIEFGAEAVSTYISKLEEIRSKLKQAGEEISEKMLMTKILMSLPDRFKHFRSAWESVPSDRQTFEELTSRLLIEEEREKHSEEATALTVNAKQFQKKGNGFDKANIKCHYCHKQGHFARECYKKKENSDQKRCTYCKKEGHLVADCFFRKNKREIAREIVKRSQMKMIQMRS